MNTVVWGHGTWETFLLVCHAADETGKCGRALDFMTLQTQALPCEPCREFFSHCITTERRRLLDSGDGDAVKVQLVPWLYDLRAVIDAKIAGSLGSDDAWTAVIPRSSRFGLQMRVASVGPLISSAGVVRQLMLQAVRVGALERQRKASAAQLQLRTQSQAHAVLILAELLRDSRPALSRALDACARRVSEWDWALLLASLWRCGHSLEDGLGPLEDECEHLRLAETSLHDWTASTMR